MSIQPGDKLPEIALQELQNGAVRSVSIAEAFGGKDVVLFAVPGAFTPTCSEAHLPGFVEAMPAFRDLGVEVIGISVNDAFVMGAWGQQQGAPEDLRLLADGNGEFSKAIGLSLDASAYGMGLRSKRFALYAENGVVRWVEEEAPGEFRVSSAEHVLERLRSEG